MKKHHAIAHMRAAHIYSELSYCIRRKVGCVIVKNDRVVSIGYNGTPPGWDNCCEDEHNVTKPEVRHAEDNALDKVRYEKQSVEGAMLFVTTAPCMQCAEMIIEYKIAKVFFGNRQRSPGGVQYLIDNGIEVEQIEITN